MRLKMSSAANTTDELSIVANSMDPEQTAPIGAVGFGYTPLPKRLLQHFGRREKQTTFVAIGRIRVKNNFWSSF